MVVANVHKIYDHSRVINFISQVQVQNQSGYSFHSFFIHYFISPVSGLIVFEYMALYPH